MKDTFDRDQSLKTIDFVIKTSAEKSPKEIAFAIRRAYPFGTKRQGKPYKIWRLLVIAKEKELGDRVKRQSS